MRLVPNQDPNKIAKLFTNYVKQIAPKTVRVEVREIHGGYPIVTPMNNEATIAASKAMARAFGKKTVYMREGGSIPIVTVFAKQLNAIPVLMGLGLNTENLHSPNEHFGIWNYLKGIETIPLFYKYFTELSK